MKEGGGGQKEEAGALDREGTVAQSPAPGGQGQRAQLGRLGIAAFPWRENASSTREIMKDLASCDSPRPLGLVYQVSEEMWPHRS